MEKLPLPVIVSVVTRGDVVELIPVLFPLVVDGDEVTGWAVVKLPFPVIVSVVTTGEVVEFIPVLFPLVVDGVVVTG